MPTLNLWCQLFIIIFIRLTPGMKYLYSFGDDNYGWSKQYTFTVPLPGPDVTTKIIAYGGKLVLSSHSVNQDIIQVCHEIFMYHLSYH